MSSHRECADGLRDDVYAEMHPAECNDRLDIVSIHKDFQNFAQLAEGFHDGLGAEIEEYRFEHHSGVSADIEEAMSDVDKTETEDAWRKQCGCVRQLSDRLNSERRRDSLNEGSVQNRYLSQCRMYALRNVVESRRPLPLLIDRSGLSQTTGLKRPNNSVQVRSSITATSKVNMEN